DRRRLRSAGSARALPRRGADREAGRPPAASRRLEPVRDAALLARSRRGMRGCHDVAIVGYGPVGQTLAILLGQRGWNVAVFEKQPAAYPLPRAVHFDHEVARILQAAGLGEELPRLTEPADTYEWRNAAGETLLVIRSRG